MPCSTTSRAFPAVGKEPVLKRIDGGRVLGRLGLGLVLVGKGRLIARVPAGELERLSRRCGKSGGKGGDIGHS